MDMCAFASFCLITLTFVAYVMSHMGEMYISKINKEVTYQKIYIPGDKGIVGGSSIFLFDEGVITYLTTGESLAFNNLQKLVPDIRRHFGLGLERIEGSKNLNILVYDGSSVFYICSDSSISFYKYSCDGARDIEITYRALW